MFDKKKFVLKKKLTYYVKEGLTNYAIRAVVCNYL